MCSEPTGPARSRRRPRVRVVAIILAVLVGILAVGWVVAERLTEPGDPVIGVSEISVQDNSFSPDSVEVAPGTAITWTWEGDAKHNIHGDGFEAPTQVTGTYAHTFDDPGTYDYECTLHFGMKGRIIVTDDPDLPGAKAQ